MKSAESPLYLEISVLKKISDDLSIDPGLIEFFNDIEIVRALEIVSERGLLDIPKYSALTISEGSALTKLTMNYGYVLSDALVSGNLTSFQQKMVSLLDNTYTKLTPYTANMTLYRLEFRSASELSTWSIGTELNYPNYISTAKSTESSYIDGGSFNNILFKINNDNLSAINMEDFSVYSSELEALIKRGKKLKIRSISLEDHPDLGDWLINDQMNPSGSSKITTIVVDIID